MILQLVGIESIENRSLTNFYARVSGLVQRKYGGDAPEIRLRVERVSDDKFIGELELTPEKRKQVTYKAEALDARGILVEILARIMKDFRYSLTDLIKVG